MNAAAPLRPPGRCEPAGRPPPQTGAPPQLSIILPTYNEAGNIRQVLRRIEAAVIGKLIAAEVLVMDDGSPDGTADAAEGVPCCVPVRVIRRQGPRGLSEAVAEGILHARGEFVLVMDADLQHPPESIPELVAALRGGAEFVIGSRFAPGGVATRFGALRRLNSWGATLLCRPLLSVAVSDPMSGCFACRRKDIAGLELRATGYKIGLELLVKSGARRIVETPITFGARQAGASKLTLRQQALYLRHLSRLYAWRFPIPTQFVRFCAVGACGMTVDLTLMTLLIGAGLSFPSARTWSILAALPVNFALNRRWTFAGRAAAWLTQFARFAGACSIGLVVSWMVSNGLFLLLPSWRGAYRILCAAGIVAGTLANFHFSRSYAFADAPAQDVPRR